ncbi:AlbA family DNA-binding domain-containing protein [Rhizobium ruizarguesonis]|uniref:AlbA family DNA-binding domain-containing protein n=1 Tax=Rhizobium ruizarguesonis TaxID=2081791 RepID=UPI00103208C8|nr:ATP-binding protein [Rhizobium ruizarguesonis]TBF08918.1 hypothetical protein ELG96_09530 [Rhizobium ruizarguesonis]
MSAQIEEYIDHPVENLHVEYKDWLNLSEPIHRANLARHMAAISNHGGGYIIFGFADSTMTSTGENPFDASHYTHDGIASISQKYHEPAIHCDVEIARGHVVIRIPAHANVPICAKANGPMVDSKVKGIVSGAIYIRKPGPQSVPITNAHDWSELIRRCVLHDSAALLKALGSALLPPTMQSRDRTLDLKEWHDATRAAYVAELGKNRRPGYLKSNYTQLSYIIEDGEKNSIRPDLLKQVLREVNFEMRDLVNTGWSILFPFDREPISPYFTSDPAVVERGPFLEQSLVSEVDSGPNFELWRVSPDGIVSVIRPLRTDFLEFGGWQELRYFSPNRAARELAELVRHATGLALRFPETQHVSFRCEWAGIRGRTINDELRDWSPRPAAKTDSVISTGRWSIIELSSNWPAIVASLLGPVTRAFDPTLSLSKDWVAAEAQAWRPLGDHYP